MLLLLLMVMVVLPPALPSGLGLKGRHGQGRGGPCSAEEDRSSQQQAPHATLLMDSHGGRVCCRLKDHRGQLRNGVGSPRYLAQVRMVGSIM